MGASWQAFYAHLCAASIIRAMPETEIPPLCGGSLLYRKYIREIVLSLHWENVDTIYCNVLP